MRERETHRDLNDKPGPGVKGPGPNFHRLYRGGSDGQQDQDRQIAGDVRLRGHLLYIRDHPGCKKSEIYQNVTRNAHTPERIGMMESDGLIRMEETPRSNVSLMYLTEKGDRLVDLLLEAESMLRTYRVRCRPRLCHGFRSEG